MKTWQLNLVHDTKTGMYWGFDFTITRPLISDYSLDKVKKYLDVWQKNIKKDYKRTPKIISETTEDIHKYIKQKKRYYNKLWKSQV